MDTNDLTLISAQRMRIYDRIRGYAKRKYDARPLLPEFFRLSKILMDAGRSLRESGGCFSYAYWQDPATYKNQDKNKNPVIDCKDGEIICANDPAHIIKEKKVTDMQPRQTTIEHNPKKTPESYYYKVNISWVERADTPKDVIDEICAFMKGAGLEPIKVHDFNNGYEIEKTAEFKMQGGEESFRWVKRCIMSHLERFVGGIPEFNIAISGKKYEDFEI